MFLYKDFEMRTLYTYDRVIARLNDSMCSKFYGSIEGEQFYIRPSGTRCGTYFYRPVITGTITDHYNSTYIRGEVRGSFGLKVYIFLLSLLLTFSFIALLLIYTGPNDLLTVVYTSVGFFLLCFYVLCSIFLLYVKRSLKLLKKILVKDME